MESLEEKFVFWCPLQKSENLVDPTTGEQIMRLGGIASTSDEDSDGEFLDPKGFDIKPLLASGMVNWHHQAKEHPDTIIGEPTKAEIRPEGLYIETDLYPSSKVACDVWELANTLEKDSKTRRLGYSIEGKVLKRKSNDKNSPDYKHIEKAIITGVAITHMPKNPKTFANIIKGDIEDDFNNEEDEKKNEKQKSLDTESGAALKKESVDSDIKVTTFSKAEVMEKIFQDIPGISIEKANKIHLMINKYAIMKGKVQITDDDITKAYEALGLNVEESDIVKGCGNGDAAAKKAPISKAKGKAKGSEEPDGDEADVETDEEPDGDEDGGEADGSHEEPDGDEVSEAKVRKAEGGNRFDRIEKAISESHAMNSKYIRALGVMIKDASNKLDAAAERENELMSIIKAQDETISSLSERIEEFGNEVPAPKSLSHARPVERAFAKADDNDITKGGAPAERKENVFSMTTNHREIAELLDQATFAKGYDEEFSKACTAYEAVHTLPANIIARMKNEYGVEIVK